MKFFTTRNTIIITLLLVVIAIVVGWYFYPQLPQEFASHWDEHGQVNGYMSRFWGVALLPAVTLGLLILFLVIPLIDPLRRNIEKFRPYFNMFILAIVVFMFYLDGLSLVWNLGHQFDFTTVMVPALAILWYLVGSLMENAKQNWFIGIRTPWTLSSEVVWEKTHALGAKLFKISAAIALLGLVWPNGAILLAVIPVAAVSIYTFIYSYLEFRKQKQFPEQN